MPLNLAQIVESSSIYGPGNRAVIWTQGCSLRCKGCWNQTMWEFGIGNSISIEDLLQKVQAIPDIEGITLLGGEPFDQYPEVYAFVQAIKTQSPLTVMVFTGYELEELEQSQRTEILAHIDILITGRYVQQYRNTHLQWIGSSNQSIHFLSDQYRNYDLHHANYTELQIDEFGQMTALGFPNFSDIKNLMDM